MFFVIINVILCIALFHLLFFPVLPSRVHSCYTMSCSVMSYLVLSCPIQRSVESIELSSDPLKLSRLTGDISLPFSFISLTIQWFMIRNQVTKWMILTECMTASQFLSPLHTNPSAKIVFVISLKVKIISVCQNYILTDKQQDSVCIVFLTLWSSAHMISECFMVI